MKPINNNNSTRLFFTFIFASSLIIFFISFFANLDMIWVYGNSLKISQGYLPYRDFNLITTPLFYALVALFIWLINQHVIVYLLLCALINCGVYYLCYRILLLITNNKALALLTAQLIFLYTIFTIIIFSYNTFVVLLILWVLYIDIKDIGSASIKNQLIIGSILGAIILTKHSVGAITTFFSFIYVLVADYPGKLKFRALCCRFMALVLVVGLFLGYLIISDSLNDFINYAVLGLTDFAQGNKSFSLFSIGYFLLAAQFLAVAVFKMIRKQQPPYQKCIVLYSLAALAICFPIFDVAHISIAIIPILILPPLLFNFSNKKAISLTRSFIFLFLVMLIVLLSIGNLISYRDGPAYFKYTVMNNSIYQYMSKVNAYIKQKENQGYSIVMPDTGAMFYMLTQGKIHAPYDYLIQGNLGKNGEQRIINEFQALPDNTLFLMNSKYSNQDIIKVKQAIINDYQRIDQIEDFGVYQHNKKLITP